jgi:BTB/POZ domain
LLTHFAMILRSSQCFVVAVYVTFSASFDFLLPFVFTVFLRIFDCQPTEEKMSEQQFFLKWNDFQNNMVSSFKHLRDEKSFTDVSANTFVMFAKHFSLNVEFNFQVTLACDGQTCKAHKMVLSACSPYFKTLLEENPSKHPIIILKDVSFNHLQAILEFM